MQRTFEEVRALLAEKLRNEKLRLKSYGTKADSFSLAHALTEHVRAMRSDARLEEVNELIEWLIKTIPKDKRKKQAKVVLAWLKDRRKGLETMRSVLKKSAQERDENRPWKRSSPPSDQKHKKKSTSSKHKKR